MSIIKCRPSVLCLLPLFIFVLFGTAAMAAGRAGVTIESNAQLQYELGAVSSEFSSVTIGQMYGITVEPASLCGIGIPDTTYYFPHWITNFGNGSDQITFGFTTATPETWTFGLKRDLDGDGIFEPGDGEGDLDNPLLIGEEGLVHFLIAVTIPMGESTGVIGECVLLATGEVNDGGPYMGANGTIYGGYDSAEATDILTVESLPDLMIHREDATGRIYLTWNGGNADVYFLNDTYNASFEGAMIEASDESSPYDCLTLEAQDGKIRYYRIKLSGNTGYVNKTVGKFDIDTVTGFTLTSIPFVFTSEAATSLDAVIGTQLTGGTLPVSADRMYSYMSTPPPYGTWKQAYLKTGSGGGWFGTLLNFGSDIGAWIRILEGHSIGKLTYVGIVSEAASREIVLHQGYNMVGTAYPVEISIDATNLDSVLTSGDLPVNADRIYCYEENTWKQSYLKTGVGWVGTVTKLAPGRAYWIKKQGTSGTWFYPKPYVSEYY